MLRVVPGKSWKKTPVLGKGRFKVDLVENQKIL